jgi:hypothetical protein
MQVFQYCCGAPLGHQPGEQMLGADFSRAVGASLLHSAVQAHLQSGCGPGSEWE